MGVREPASPFDYTSASGENLQKMADLQAIFERLLDHLLALVPSSRERSISVTKLEESAMWANKGITHTKA